MIENSETHIITIFILIISLVCAGAVIIIAVMPKRKKQGESKKDKKD